MLYPMRQNKEALLLIWFDWIPKRSLADRYKTFLSTLSSDVLEISPSDEFPY